MHVDKEYHRVLGNADLRYFLRVQSGVLHLHISAIFIEVFLDVVRKIHF